MGKRTLLVPLGLQCEYRANPLGIMELHPRLGWKFESHERGCHQSAYQILVASDPTVLHEGVGDLWDTGKVLSDRMNHIPYDGLPLRDRQRCWWMVRVWDEADRPGLYSSVTWWEVGLLELQSWQSQWISLPRQPDSIDLPVPTPPCPMLRTEFILSAPVARARLYVTAKGVYEMRLNGQRVGTDLLAPGWTDYHLRLLYQTYDVTDMLHTGANAIGAILGDGWYSGYIGPYGKRDHYGDHPELLVQLHIELATGESIAINSDGRWCGTTGYILGADLLHGEHQDGRLVQSGWDSPGFADSTWQRVTTIPLQSTTDAPVIVADSGPPIQILSELTPVSITAKTEGVHLIDFGQNLVGWLRLRLRGQSGDDVTLRFAEMLDEWGNLYQTNLRTATQCDTYRLHGQGEEIFEPHFTFHGFRFVEVVGIPGTMDPADVIACVIGSALPSTGELTCSSAMLNRLQQNILWSQKGNFISVPTDCPQRDERLGWLGDAQIFARTAMYNNDVAAFYTRWLDTVADAQFLNGAFSDVAPRVIVMSEGAPGWGDAGIILPWTLYQQYGDVRIIERHWQGMTRWMDHISEANPTGIWNYRRNTDYGDWLNMNDETPKDLLATAFYANSAQLMMLMARILGRVQEAEHYKILWENIKDAFVTTFVTPDGRLTGDTQTGYALALQIDLLPTELRKQAAQHLIANIKRRSDHLSTGFLGVRYLLPALTEIGATDVAYQLLLNETYPSWGYSILHGATTIWERWDGWTKERGFQDPAMNSFNHYSLGSVGEWLYRYVAGIDLDPDEPDAAGYKHILLRPHPNRRIGWVKTTFASISGTIHFSWSWQDSQFQVEVNIPANTTARLWLPTTDPKTVREGMRSLDEVEGIVVEQLAPNLIYLHLASGEYHFTTHLSHFD